MRIASTIPSSRSAFTSMLAPLVLAEPCLEFVESPDLPEADFGVCSTCGWLDHEHHEDKRQWADILVWPNLEQQELKAS